MSFLCRLRFPLIWQPSLPSGTVCDVAALILSGPCLCELRLPKLAQHQYLFPGAVIVKASSGPRYVVGCRRKLDKSKLIPNTRVTLDMTTLTIMRALPREVRHRHAGAGHCCHVIAECANVQYGKGQSDRVRSLVVLPQVDPVVYNMLSEDPGKVTHPTACILRGPSLPPRPGFHSGITGGFSPTLA